eukprot:162394-Pelagomonas_calceolata.AAC.1
MGCQDTVMAASLSQPDNILSKRLTASLFIKKRRKDKACCHNIKPSDSWRKRKRKVYAGQRPRALRE